MISGFTSLGVKYFYALSLHGVDSKQIPKLIGNHVIKQA